MNRYDEIRQYVNELIVDIEKMNFYENKVVCLYSIVDSFAQEYFKYKELNNSQRFCQFILKYANKEKYNYLELIDPVTLIYDVSGAKVQFEELSESSIYTPTSLSISELRNRIEVIGAEEKFRTKHKYIELLYKNRSKIIHEGNSTGLIRVEPENNYDFPIYFECTNYCRLVFPYKFLKDLFFDCINNYLINQQQLGLDPFENNINRKSFYAFYD